MRTVLKSLPFRGICPAQTARWLEEQAQNGLLLRGTLGYSGILRFERVAPSQVRYHAEYAKRGAPIAFETADGDTLPWEEIGEARGMRIYRCNDPDAPAPTIDTDAELTALRRERTSTLLFAILWTVLIGLWVHDLFVPSIFISMTESFAIAKMFLIVAFAMMVVSRAWLFIDVMRAIKRLQRGDDEPLPHRTKRYGVTVLCGGTAVFLSVLTVLLSLVLQPSVSFEKSAPTIEDLIENVDPLHSGSSFALTREFSLIAPTQFSMRQQGMMQFENGAGVYVDLAATYYETWSPTIAAHLVKDLTKTDFMKRYEEPHLLDCGIDYVAVYEWSQVAFLQHGNRVLKIDLGLSSGALDDTLARNDWVRTAAAWLLENSPSN